MLIVLLASAVAVLAWLSSEPSRAVLTPLAEPPLAHFDLQPKSLAELLALSPDQLAKVDLARMNLLCAAGLPGAEHLNIDAALTELDRWAYRVRHETDRYFYKFLANPKEYENSEGYFRMLMLVTVLQQDLGVHYNMARVRNVDFTHAQDLFIHGMIPAPGQPIGSTNGGTCVSMPVLYTAVARRLGYPVKLVTTQAHVFCRWDSPTERFNIEGSGRGMNSYKDDYYKTWPMRVSDAAIRANRFLMSTTPAEELAEFLVTRGHNLLDTGRIGEAMAAYRAACKLAPGVQLYESFYAEARHRANPRAYARWSSRPAARTGEDAATFTQRERFAIAQESQEIMEENRRHREAEEKRVQETLQRYNSHPSDPFAPAQSPVPQEPFGFQSPAVPAPAPPGFANPSGLP